jgi:LmbE family N-acetylglucosaminyl deacetylase
MDTEGKRVLAVGAHPDDVEFMCSGTLAHLADEGFEIHIVTLTWGDGGSMEHPPGDIARIRSHEAEAACRVLGATYHYGGFYDFGIFNTDSANRRVTGLFREIGPWLVITHPPEDYLSDHEFTSRLVRNACFYAAVPNYDTLRYSPIKKSKGIPFLFYAQPVEGLNIYGERVEPHFYVDVSEKMELREAMLACHESQRSWLRTHHGMDEYLNSMKRWARELAKSGHESTGRAVQAAEAFRQHRGHAYPKENILAQILPEHVF